MCSALARMPRTRQDGEIDGLEKLVNERQAAKILSVSPRALQKWRSNGRGPPFIRISARCIRYRLRDLAKWTADRLRNSTSDIRSQSPTNLRS